MADKTKKFLNKNEHYELIKKLAEDHNLTQIGKILGCGATCVSEFTRKHGIKTQYGKTRRSIEERLDEIIELNKSMFASEIGKKIGVSESYVRKLLAANGIKSKEQIDRDILSDLLREHASSMYLEEFCNKFGYVRSTASNLAKSLGIEFSNKHRVDFYKDEIEAIIHTTPLTEVARQLGIDRSSLLGYVKRNNLPYIFVPNKEWLPGHVVYAYYDKDGIVRYYGEGSKEERAYQFASHAVTKGYLKYFSDCEPVVKILHYGLSKEEAQRIEQELVNENLDTIKTIYNHRKTSRRKRNIDFDTINELVYYDETSPTCLRWKVTDNYGNKVVGKQAGYISKTNKYASIHFSKLGTFRCHVLVWLLHNGSIDITKCVDHINGDRQDNRICNLREVTHSENCKNKPGRSNTGYKNLTWSERWNRYHVYWNVDGKRKSETFKVTDNCTKDQALSDALSFRETKIKEGLIIIQE